MEQQDSLDLHPLDNSRRIIERVIIEGKLKLLSLTHFGTGGEGLLLGESVWGNIRVLLPGSLLSGSLRHYLQTCNLEPEFISQVDKLFGKIYSHNTSEQSHLIVDDSWGQLLESETRQGISINSISRTAYDGYSFEHEFLQAGTTLDIRFELVICQGDEKEKLEQILAFALDGLATGKISLGLRKHRGFGRCTVSTWSVSRYDLKNPFDLLNWIDEENASEAIHRKGDSIADLLGVRLDIFSANIPSLFHLRANFQLESSLLIRTDYTGQGMGPDTVHLQTQDGQPVLSGTTLAGALRHRALRIARTIAGDQFFPGGKRVAKDKVLLIVNRIFGTTNRDANDQASRLISHEAVIQNGHSLIQNRITLDRFTGSILDSNLFNEQPIFGDDQTYITIELSLSSPESHEIGLLLLLLKDLWTGDLSLGGQSSIGRGYLLGHTVYMTHGSDIWNFRQIDGSTTIEGDKQKLELYVSTLQTELRS